MRLRYLPFFLLACVFPLLALLLALLLFPSSSMMEGVTDPRSGVPPLASAGTSGVIHDNFAK